MRYSTLVFAAFMAVFAPFASTSAVAQKAERVIEVNPVDEIIVDYLAKADQERGGDPAGTYVMGRVTDFSGRSVRGAAIMLFHLDSDEVFRATTNGFGYYRFPNLAEGANYLISIQHRKYIFVMGSVSFTTEATPLQIDFQAEEMP